MSLGFEEGSRDRAVSQPEINDSISNVLSQDVQNTLPKDSTPKNQDQYPNGLLLYKDGTGTSLFADRNGTLLTIDVATPVNNGDTTYVFGDDSGNEANYKWFFVQQHTMKQTPALFTDASVDKQGNLTFTYPADANSGVPFQQTLSLDCSTTFTNIDTGTTVRLEANVNPSPSNPTVGIRQLSGIEVDYPNQTKLVYSPSEQTITIESTGSDSTVLQTISNVTSVVPVGVGDSIGSSNVGSLPLTSPTNFDGSITYTTSDSQGQQSTVTLDPFGKASSYPTLAARVKDVPE